MWFSETVKGIGPKLFFAVIVFGSVLNPAKPATQREERWRESKGNEAHRPCQLKREEVIDHNNTTEKNSGPLYLLPLRFIRLSLLLNKIEYEKRISYVKKFCVRVHACQILKHIQRCYLLFKGTVPRDKLKKI
jgi:hypothetical protein